MKPIKNKTAGYSLIEVSIAVFVLAIGVLSLLSIFPVAMRWGGEAVAGNTGSLAAKTALAYLQEDTALGTISAGTKEYKVGVPGSGGYFVYTTVATSPKAADLYEAIFRVYKLDFGTGSTLSTKVKEKAEKDILGTYTALVYDK